VSENSVLEGHAFSRAENSLRASGLYRLRKDLFYIRTGLYGLHKSSVLYQGTTLVGPQTIEKRLGFSP
jgi:hypothetical protein